VKRARGVIVFCSLQLLITKGIYSGIETFIYHRQNESSKLLLGLIVCFPISMHSLENGYSAKGLLYQS